MIGCPVRVHPESDRRPFFKRHVYDRERTVGIDLDFRFVDLSGKIDIFYPFPVKAVHHDFLPIKEREEYMAASFVDTPVVDSHRILARSVSHCTYVAEEFSVLVV